MTKEVLANLNMPWLPSIGLLLFLVLFVGMLIWINRRGSDDFYRQVQGLPMDDGNKKK